MWIEHTGGVGYLNPDSEKITIAMTDPTGTVTVEQMGETNADWFAFKDGAESMDLNSDNTAKSIYAPIKLRITAVGTGVRLYHRKKPNKQPVVIRK